MRKFRSEADAGLPVAQFWRSGWTRVAGRVIPPAVSIALLLSLFRDVDVPSLASSIRSMTRSPWGWIALVISFASHFGFSTVKWRDLLIGLGHGQPFLRLLRLELASDLFIRVVPLRDGEVAKIWVFATKYRVPALVTAASVAIEIATNVGALVLLAISGQVAVGLRSPMAGLAACTLLFTSAIFVSHAVLRHVSRAAGIASAKPNTPRKKLRTYAERASRIPRTLLARVALLSLLIEFSEVVVVAMLCRAMSIDVPLSALVALWPIAAIAGRLPISIGGIGVRDGALVALLPRLTAATYEQTLGVGLAFTMVGVLIPCLIGLPFTARLLSSMIDSKRSLNAGDGDNAEARVIQTADAPTPHRP